MSIRVSQMIAQAGYTIRFFSLAITVLSLAACGSNPAAPPAAKQPSSGQVVTRVERPTAGDRAAAVALDQVGVPYRYGGSSPGGFDCSGLVQYSYTRAGVRVPRTTGQLWSASNPVGRAELRAGDLLFFSIEGKMSHVGVYLGEQRFVHAPQSGRKVSVASLNSPFYRAAFIRAGRPY
jgi:cell wall-associated NlpC family hydrolase